MKITKAELIEMEVCEEGLARFIKQTGNTNEPVEIASLVGGENTYEDLLWLAGEMLKRERIVRFACDCALVNIELIKPYTDEYDMTVEFLRNPTASEANSVSRTISMGALTGWASDVYATRATHAATRATCAANSARVTNSARVAAVYAARITGAEEKVNELLKGLFA